MTHPRLALAALLVVPVLGSILCVIATRHGIGIGQDSAAYMGAADNLLHAWGITTPFDLSGSTLSPARYSLSTGQSPSCTSHRSIRFSRGHFFNRTVDRQWGEMAQCNLDGCKPVRVRVARPAVLNVTPLVPIAAAFLLLAGPAVFFHQNLLLIDEGAWSEPFFLFVFLLSVLFIEVYLDHPTPGWFVGIAVCVAVAPLFATSDSASLPEQQS